MARQLDMALFSKRLKEARTDRNMTQKELSEMSGVSTVMLSAYERNNTQSGKNPALNNIYAIATALGVSIDWLCGLSDDSTTDKNEADVDTKTFLYSIIKIVDIMCEDPVVRNVDYLRELAHYRNKNTVDVFEFFEGTTEPFYNFVSDYIEMRNIIRKEYVSNNLSKKLIDVAVENYKNKTIAELFMWAGEDNANNSEA